VSLLVNAKPGETILDYCAGGGGKSLALAAEMKNEGKVHAFDIDKRRLVTCSMLAEENEGQIYPFLEDNKDFTLLSAGEVYEEKIGVNAPKPWSEDGCTLTLTPASTGTDGFFFAVMERTA